MRESLQETYPCAWRKFWKLRVLHWLSWAVLILWIVIGVRVSLDIRSWLGLLFAFLVVCFLSFTYGMLAGFICPRCHKQFLVGPLVWPIPFQSSCFHCGLPKYADEQV
jgi:hypothetical protein